ncbi:hypothetical protein B0H16DRAFT_1888521 [Mycena metata]|uniref:Uncharacterized protein n=1 Tax=Mycena metata TaxID=1033252 RepID=A0AAD7IPW9_9AGAR|nr:hypothetical protein B0H16DRAFT_1888521 [Mycena metata]
MPELGSNQAGMAAEESLTFSRNLGKTDARTGGVPFSPSLLIAPELSQAIPLRPPFLPCNTFPNASSILEASPTSTPALVKTSVESSGGYSPASSLPPNFPLGLLVSHSSHPPSPAIMSTRADACGCDIAKYAREGTLDTFVAGMDLGAGPNRGAAGEHGCVFQKPQTLLPRWSCYSESAPSPSASHRCRAFPTVVYEATSGVFFTFFEGRASSTTLAVLLCFSQPSLLSPLHGLCTKPRRACSAFLGSKNTHGDCAASAPDFLVDAGGSSLADGIGSLVESECPVPVRLILVERTHSEACSATQWRCT